MKGSETKKNKVPSHSVLRAKWKELQGKLMKSLPDDRACFRDPKSQSLKILPNWSIYIKFSKIKSSNSDL